MRRLCSASNLPEAHLLLHRLAQAGIAARVFNEYAQGGLGEIPFTYAWPEVWVLEDRDEERARAILADYERSHSVPETRPCPDCGELNPESFELCWRCGATLV